jgi:amino acid adenylation domain-containing protein/thioester reductase-like protein
VVVRESKNACRVLVAMHHIVGDGWSTGVLLEEIMALYTAWVRGETPQLPTLTIQYGDFAAWQRANLGGDRLDQRLAYWQERLQGIVARLDLPADRSRPLVAGSAGGRLPVELPPSLSDRLRSFASRFEATPFMVLLAVFAVVLHRYSGQNRFAIGVPIAGRDRKELERLIGCFLNMLALPMDAEGEPTFGDFLGRVRQVVLEAHEHGDTPFEAVVARLAPERDPSYSPLFQTSFSFERESGDRLRFPAGLEGRFDELDLGVSRYDLTLELTESATGIRGWFDYSVDLFDRDTIERLARHFLELLADAIERPGERIGTLNMLSPDERDMLLVAWNQTQTCHDMGVTAHLLHRLIERQVERSPLATALSFGSRKWTYQELNEEANRLAAHLQGLGVGPNTVVAVCMERSIELVIGLLAVLKAGGAYLPLDLDYPPERLSFMFRDSGAGVLLHMGDLPIWAGDEVATGVSHKLRLELGAKAPWANAPAENPASPVEEGNLAYVIYTSGSTGSPKGAGNTHRGICNRLLWMQDEYKLEADDRVLQKTPFSFDVSVWEFFWPLLAGAELVVAPPGAHRDSAWLASIIRERSVTTLHFVPSMLNIFLQDSASAACDSIRRVICSGEALPYELKCRFQERFCAGLHNLYGPTEAAVDVTYWDCAQSYDRFVVPIGRPIANTRIYILDGRGQPVPINVPGEIHIGGVGVGAGYLNHQELTARRFLPDPFSKDPAARLYRTGDLARFNRDGVIEFLGRIDHQVKVRGMRIELSEIELALTDQPGVRQAVVLAREDNPGDQRLVAYIVAQEDGKDQVDEVSTRQRLQVRLKEALKASLPDYMVPNAFVLMQRMPLLPNGKVDRKALPVPEGGDLEMQAHYVAPRTPLESELARIWSTVLGVPRIGVRDDFFVSGGHSLLAAQLILRLRETVGREIPLRALFLAPTVEGMVHYLENHDEYVLDTGNPAWSRMRQDACLPLDIVATAPPSARAAWAEVLLTGATGFVGVYLLRDLLHRTGARVVCLVRARDVSSGMERLRAAVDQYGLLTEGGVDFSRVEVVAGDLGRPRLGLSQQEWSRLAGRMDAIYHCAASVNFIAPYEQLRQANVDGTRELLRLAVSHHIKPVHFVSTIYVLTDIDRANAPALTENHTPLHGDRLNMGYLQSKWVAERLAMAARDRGVPVSIYRLGRISGDSATGACQKEDSYWGLLRGCIKVGAVPDLDLGQNLLPVDQASRAIVALSLDKEQLGGTYHLQNCIRLPGVEVLAALETQGYHLESMRYADWRERVLELVRREPGDPSAKLAGLLFGDQESKTPAFSAEQTLSRLELLGACPMPVGPDLLKRYVRYFINTGFFPAPERFDLKKSSEGNCFLPGSANESGHHQKRQQDLSA